MKHKLFTLFATLVCATTSFAQVTVMTDQELRNEVQINNANIIVGADIDLSNRTLEIAEGKTVTIDLGGHTLDRKLTQRGEGGGQVITVRNGATLILKNGTLKGGWGGDGGGLVNEGGIVTLTNVNITGNTADDRGGGISNHGTLTMTGGSITNNISNDGTDPKGGGGIMNSEGATATLTNVTITGNTVNVTGGGGICNYGTMTLDGCTITGNSCKMNGGGIWTAASATLNIKGANTVTGNTTANSVTNNLFLKTDAVVTVTGSLTGSNVGIIMETPGVFTSGYSTYHSGTDPVAFFTSDEAQFLMMPADTEAGLAVHYIERSWDEANHTVVNHDKVVAGGHYTVLTSKNGDDDVVTLGEGVYVVKGSININNIKCTDAVKLVLCDGCTLTVKNGIRVDDFKDYGSIFIYSQSYGDAMGKIRTTVTDDDFHGSALGAGSSNHLGPIEIHGGDIRAEGRDGDEEWIYEDDWNYQSGTGIGGSVWNDGNYITIYGGKIEAIAYYEECAIGLGGCWNYNMSDPKGCVITIYDGHVTATAKGNGAGIGNNCIYNNDHGAINIHGGYVEARSTENGAGIGGGGRSYSGDILITGGEVHAYGGNNGAGIGCGSESILNEGLTCNTVTITGGTVYAYGGTDAAGIGGGEDGDGGTINISGGYVYAEGNDNGAGIGGGQGGDGANVTITGGTVVVKAGGDQRAIGAGYGSDNHGSLSLADNLGVFVTTDLKRSVKENRVSDCRNFKDVRINKCEHGGATFANQHDGTHTVSGCNFCSAATEPHTYDENNQCTRCAEEKIILADHVDNTDIISNNQSQERTVVLEGRTLYKDGNWNTLCLPFDMVLEGSPLEGATVKTLSSTSFDNGTLTMNFSNSDLTSIEAGKPYIIKWDKEKNASVVIRTYVDWNAFATMVNEHGTDFSGKTVLLAEDIIVDKMVGTSDHSFKGIFDGNGHTLTFYQTATEECAAPFRYAKNATICNLTVDGHITTSAKCAAGFIGRSFGKVNISNCRSSVIIESSIDLNNSENGDGTHGGFIASIDEGSATFSNCLFDGKLLGEGTNRWGGFVGWKSTYNAAKANFNNCFFKPSEVTFSRTLSYTIVRSETLINCDIYNTYYKTSYSCAYEQGINAKDMSNDELLSALGGGWEIRGGKVLPKKVYDSNIVSPVFEGVTIGSSTTNTVETDYVDFCGTYQPLGFSANDRTMLYLGGDNTLYYPSKNMDIYAFRGYFLLEGIEAGDLPANAIMMNFNEKETTGISLTPNPSPKGEGSDYWYTLDGRKIANSQKPTAKGLYIYNGKKHVIK